MKPRLPKQEPASIEITAKDWHEHSRNSFWYVGVGLLVLAGAYLAFSLHDYIAAAVAVTVGLAIYRVAHLKPSNRTIRLTSHGVDWGGQFFAYHHLRGFWLSGVEGRATVYLERLNLSATISFIVGPNEVERVANFLATHLPWHEHKSEPLGDRLGRLLRI